MYSARFQDGFCPTQPSARDLTVFRHRGFQTFKLSWHIELTWGANLISRKADHFEDSMFWRWSLVACNMKLNQRSLWSQPSTSSVKHLTAGKALAAGAKRYFGVPNFLIVTSSRGSMLWRLHGPVPPQDLASSVASTARGQSAKQGA